MQKIMLLICVLTAFSACKPKAKNITNTSAYEASSGKFSAVLMPIDEVDLAEFDKSEHDGPRLVFKKKAICGDKVAIKISFMGMGLTENKMADVTYDIKVLSPDGTSYSGGVHNDVPAYVGIVRRPNNVFNNHGVLTLNFKPEDLIGNYKITAIVKDNVDNNELTLNQSIELLECASVKKL